MDADARTRKPASHSLPPAPALFAVRARSVRVADLGAGAGAGAAFSGPPDTPPRRSLVAVPFLWEEAPGKPKEASPTLAPFPETTTPVPAAANAGPVPQGETGGEHQDSSGHARPLPLKLPPRLQLVSASFAAGDTPLSSPKTVFQGPYRGGGGGRRTPRWVRSGGAALRRTPSAGAALLSRTWSKRRAAGSNKNRRGNNERYTTAGPDAPWCSPASSDSSSSVSTCFGGDNHGRGRPADGREVSSEEEDGSPRVSVRITRFRLRRNRSLPSLTTSNLWASIRRSVKQITSWS